MMENHLNDFFDAHIEPGRDPRRQVAIEITDESLAELGINPGEVCIVELSPEIHPDRLHAVITDRGVIVRYIVPCDDGGGYWIVPANDRYPSFVQREVDLLGYVHTIINRAVAKLNEVIMLGLAFNPSWMMLVDAYAT